MDFGAEIADRSYQEIPTGALRPRNDMLESAFDRTTNCNLKWLQSRAMGTEILRKQLKTGRRNVILNEIPAEFAKETEEMV